MREVILYSLLVILCLLVFRQYLKVRAAEKERDRIEEETIRLHAEERSKKCKPFTPRTYTTTTREYMLNGTKCTHITHSVKEDNILENVLLSTTLLDAASHGTLAEPQADSFSGDGGQFGGGGASGSWDTGASDTGSGSDSSGGD